MLYHRPPVCYITILHFVSSGIHHVHYCLSILNGFTQLYDVIARKQPIWRHLKNNVIVISLLKTIAVFVHDMLLLLLMMMTAATTISILKKLR